MLLLVLNSVVVRALWKIDVHLISTLVNKNLYYTTEIADNIQVYLVYTFYRWQNKKSV